MDMYQGPRATLQRWLDQGGPTDVSQWPEIARALRLLLEASPSPEGADAVQAGGWILVPRDPTEHMNAAGDRAQYDQREDHEISPSVYRAMVANAPAITITDAMVERALEVLSNRAVYDALPEDVRACLEAALQPGGGE